MAAAKGNDGVEVNQFPNIFRIMINGLVYFMEIETEPLFDGVTAYSNEEGASDDLWDRGMSGGNPSIAIVPLRTAPTVRLTSGRE